MHRTPLPLILGLLGLALTAGCQGFQIQGVDVNNPAPCDVFLFGGGNLQTTAPPNNAVTSLTPILQWSGLLHPQPPAGCHGWREIVQFNAVWAQAVDGNLDDAPASDYTVNALTFSAKIGPLKPGTEYRWLVEALQAAPWLCMFNCDPTPALLSNMSYFFTGPLCGPQYDAAANDVPHANGPFGSIRVPRPEFKWSEYQAKPANGCLATEAVIELTGPSGVTTFHTGSPSRYWQPAQDLMECGHYAWRVSDVYGALANNPVQGPWSNSLAFVEEFEPGTRCAGSAPTQAQVTIGPPPPYPTFTPRPAPTLATKKRKTPVPACTQPPSCIAPQYLWHPDTCTCEYIPG
jgi:hypothetical protein